MNSAAYHRVDCRVIFQPALPDRFYLDMHVYRVVRAPSAADAADGSGSVWRGIYLAVEVKPWIESLRSKSSRS